MNQAQIIGNEDGLCGPASVTWVLSNNIPGITLQQVVGRYVDLLKSSTDPFIWKCEKAKGSAECICSQTDPQNSDKCIEFARSYSPSWNGVGHLSQLINKGYGEFWNAHNGVVSNKQMATSQIKRVITTNGYIIVGNQVDRSIGELRSGWPEGKFGSTNNVTSHFMVITGYSVQWNESAHFGDDVAASPWQWVRVYNPFDNQTEYYWWEDFWLSWKNDGQSYVEAFPKQPSVKYKPSKRCAE